MTPDEQRMRDIEQAEQWFRKVCRDPESPDADRINRRVRIAINEQWLDRGLSEQPPADLADRAKRRVWAAVAAEKTDAGTGQNAGRDPRARRRLLRWAGGLGIAAAACLAIYLGGKEPSLPAIGPTLSMLTAFEGFEPDELSQSLADLSDDLTELELAFDTVSAVSLEEESLNDLMDAVDDLIREGETGALNSDWS